MRPLEDLLSLLNGSPNLVGDIDWVDETNEFDPVRMEQIIRGIKDYLLMDDIIALITVEWNLLCAQKDERCYTNQDKNPWEKVLKFTGDVIIDENGWNTGKSDTIENYLEDIKLDVVYIKELVQQRQRVRQEVITRNSISLPKVDENPPESQLEEHRNLIDELILSCEKLSNQDVEREKALVDNRQASRVLLDEIKKIMIDEVKHLQAENEELKYKLEKANEEIDSLLPNYEYSEPSEADLVYIAEMEEELAAIEKEKFDRAVDKAVGDLKRESVRITELTQNLLKYPSYELQLTAFNILSFLLADNVAWKGVVGELTNQICQLASERQQKMEKIADQINILTGNNAKSEYVKPIEE